MLPPENDVELQLARELKAFDKQFSQYHGLQGTERYERFEQPLNELEMRWDNLLVKLEKAELRGCRTTADKAPDEAVVQAQKERNRRDASQMRGLDKNDQVALWSGENRMETPNPLYAEERRAQADAIYEKGSVPIQERYTSLREALRQGIEDIDKGKPPTPSQEIQAIIDKDPSGPSHSQSMSV